MSVNPKQLTFYYGAADQYPQTRALVNGWDDLRAAFHVRHVVGYQADGKTPLNTPAYSPVEFDGLGREKKNAVRVHFGVADLDGITHAEFVEFLAKIKELRALAYSTYNHGIKDGVRARVVFPFTRPVLAAEWPILWRWFDDYAGASKHRVTKKGKPARILDPLTKNADRLYYFPAKPTNDERPSDFVIEQDGIALDVDEAIRRGKLITNKPGHDDEPGEEDPGSLKTITVDNLRDLAATLKRRKNHEEKALGKAVDAICEGHVYAEPTERDVTLFKIASRLADYFTNVDPEQAASLFRRSLEATCAKYGDGDPDADEEKLIEKIGRTQDNAREQAAEAEENTLAELARETRQAFAALGIERSTFYTEDELREWRTAAGLTPEPEQGEEVYAKRWIIQRGRSFYVFVGGEYMQPVTGEELSLTLRRDLAPAYSCGVRLDTFNKDGDLVRKNTDQILQDYATAARRATVDLAAQKTVYRADRQEIIEAPCPVRTDITPRQHPGIDAWLFELAGGTQDDFARLRSWLAFVTLLDRPCVALYLDGPAGVGKTLLAKGLSRIWSRTGPTEMARAVASFNDSVITCPLIFADETLPKDVLSEGTLVLREFQQNTTRTLKRKFLSDAGMIGAIRLIMASNSKTMLDTDEHLTNVDIAAIGERILYVKATAQARTVLGQFGDTINDLVNRDMIAEHALWLRDVGAAQKPVGRFMIDTGGGGVLARSLTTHSGIRALVCHWLVAYLQSPRKYDQRNDYLCHVRDGGLWVNAQAIAEAWETYPTNARAPVAHKIGKALAGLSLSDRKQARIGGKSINYYVIDPANLIAWAEENGISNADEINAALSKPTEINAQKRLSAVPAGMFSTPIPGSQIP